MKSTGEFEVTSFVPSATVPDSTIVTRFPVGVASMEKRFAGDVEGRSTTIFTSAYDPEVGAGTYVAMESFEGSLGGRAGTFNFVHAATTSGKDRSDQHFAIVPGSGTGELATISGGGGIEIDGNGRHLIWFDYQLES